MAKPPIVINGIPQVENAIRQPGNPHHFMVLKPVECRLRVFHGERLLAETTNAVCVIEIGRTAHNPVYYIPPEGLAAPLEHVDKVTHCPLKGDASYFAVDGEEVGWAYREPFDFAAALAGRHAFWSSKVKFELGG